MAQYNSSDITNAYWAMNDGFKVGRDPMGIQNSSVATYGYLLPGMTNLTGHIRYYSLYCWLLYEYDQMEKDSNITLHQYNFIRRAELLMAFVMKERNIRSVIGANYIQSKQFIVEDGLYKIKEGADYEMKNKYWTFKTGAFGQYYLGSLIYYSLVKMVEGRFYLREKGKELAKTVINSVNKEVRELFLKCIKEGGVTDDEIMLLQTIALDELIVSSDEWNGLNELLTMIDDNGSSLRRESIYLMLKDIKKGIALSDFVEHRFLSYKNTGTNDASFGWYFYYLCEALHYAVESIFCLVLNKMNELNNPLVDILLDKTVHSVLYFLRKEQHYNNIREWMQDCNQAIDRQLSSVKTAIREQQYAEAMAHSLRLLLCLNNEFERNKTAIIGFEESHNLIQLRGIFSEALKDYVDQYLHLNPEAYIGTLLLQVMNEHTLVAVAKMGNSNTDLRKFILENGCAVLVEIRYPNATNPRIESLHNFLVDLGYLTCDNKLTKIANKYIESYGKE